MFRQMSDVLKVIFFCILLFFLIRPPLAQGETASVILYADTNYIITEYDTLFSVDVEVDQNADSLHAFKIYFSFDKDILTIPSVVDIETTIVGSDTTITYDTTLMVEEGPLLPSSGHSTQFRAFYLTPDSNSITFDDVIWGAYWVNGPGVLATIYFKTVGWGISDLVFDSLTLVGITGGIHLVTIPSAPVDGVAYVDTPPASFNLLSPVDSAVIKTWEVSSTMLDWEDATTVYPEDSILYTLYYSTSENFDPSLTDSVLNINGSQFELYVDTFTVPYSLVYWKVKAYNIYGFETWCDLSYLRFAVLPPAPPTNFNLISPPDSTVIKAFEDSSVILDWDSSVTYYPGDSVLFTLYYSPEENFDLDSTHLVDSLNESQYELPIDTFTQASTLVYWKVKAFDVLLSLETWCDPSYSYFLIVNYICGDANSDISVTVSDVVYLISYLFKGGPAPDPIQAADANNDGQVSVADVVYLISYLFKGGPPPDC